VSTSGIVHAELLRGDGRGRIEERLLHSVASMGPGLLRPVAARLLALVPVVFGVTLLVFALNAVALGDPARAAMGQRADPETLARLRREYALDRPLPVQYAAWVARLARGDLGESFREQRPVRDVLVERLPATARLALAATLISIVLGVGLGALAAARAGSALDHVLMGVAVLGISTPVFWLGMMLALVFAVTLEWLPVSGYGDGGLRHLVLPALTLGALHTGTVARMTRSSLLEVVRQDFMATARAKGLPESVVLAKHALRNALIPVVTVVGIGLADLLVGAPLTETVFAWPGVGRLLVAAVGQRDLPVVMGAVLLFALVYVLGNLLVDLAYLVIDPRMRDAARA
jgi:peptide/nickel transport system permease protein